MAKQPNFLLGNGHRLTSPVKVGKGMEPKAPPYDLGTAKQRLSSQFATAVAEIRRITYGSVPANAARRLTLASLFFAAS